MWYKNRGDSLHAPMPNGNYVETRLRDGTLMNAYPVEGIIWKHFNQSTDVIEYRMVHGKEIPG